VTLGATLKLVRGGVSGGAGTASTWDDAFGLPLSDTRSSVRGDVDAGAMLAAGQVRAGIVVRNITGPEFGDDRELRLDRHARVGVAWGEGFPGIARTVVALDADLTRVSPSSAASDLRERDRRDIAAGVERWSRGQRLAVRGGMRASTVGAARPVITGGGSWAIRPGTYVDGFFARGTRDQRDWGAALRLSY
jgi:hypothetical protein